MKLKQRIGDFRVRELLREGFVQERGDHQVYRVTKRKLTTPEAVDILADEAGVEAADVSIAGLKDRQAITIQHMTVPGGRSVSVRDQELLIEPIGRSLEALDSQASDGNAFEIVVRDLDRRDVSTLRRNLPIVREHGVVNYFDEQRFGNVKHGQGWIARDLMKGKHEKALKNLLTARSPHDSPKRTRFKERVHACWGDWRECRDEAGRFGSYHSVFEHLGKNDGDFAGAFGRVAMRIRLIHLYAYQSHLWNRAVSEFLREEVPLERRIVLDSVEGSLVTFAGEAGDLARRRSFRLPGDGLEDVIDERERALFEAELARGGLSPEEFRIPDVPGFQLKGEYRPFLVVPRHLRVRPAEPDAVFSGMKLVRVRFELPRGAYATLVVKRLFGEPVGKRREEEDGPSSETKHRSRRERRYQSSRRDDRGEDRGPRDSRDGGRYGERGDRRDGNRGGGYRGRDDRGGGYERRDDRGGQDRHRGGGGYRDRDGRGAGYGAGGSRGRDDGGGYGGRGHRGGEDRPRGGGYRGRDDRGTGSGGGYRGRDDRGAGSGGGYRGRDDRGRGYGDRDGRGGGDRPQGGGGYRDRDDRGRGQGGGYRGRDSRGSDDRSRGGGGYRGRDDRGGRYGGGGERGRDDRGRGYGGGGDYSRGRTGGGYGERGRGFGGGGYRGGDSGGRGHGGRDQRERNDGGRGYGGRDDRARDDRGGGYRGGGDRDRSYGDRENRRGAGGSYGGSRGGPGRSDRQGGFDGGRRGGGGGGYRPYERSRDGGRDHNERRFDRDGRSGRPDREGGGGAERTQQSEENQSE